MVTENGKGEKDIQATSEEVQRILTDESLGEFDKMRALYALGFSRKQLIVDFHFSKSSVYIAVPVKPEEDREGPKLPMEIPRMPLVLKVGAGHEMISPEGILQSYLLSDGDAGTWMFKGMMLLRAAQLMNLTDVEIMKGQADAQAKAIKPILDVMEQARKDMDAAAARARESSVAIAEAAAMGAAGGVLGRIDARFEELRQKKTDIATVPDPMKGLMARTMETMMNRMTGMMGGGQAGQVLPTPGLTDKRVQQQGG